MSKLIKTKENFQIFKSLANFYFSGKSNFSSPNKSPSLNVSSKPQKQLKNHTLFNDAFQYRSIQSFK